MARIRSIKPKAFRSEDIVCFPRDVRWTVAGLWTYCDDEGRGNADPRLIKAELYPLDDDVTPEVLAAELDLMECEGHICRYTVGRRTYLHVVKFKEHQHPNRPVASELPECPHPKHPLPKPEPEFAHGASSEPAVSAHGAHTAVVVVGGGDVGEVETEGEVSAIALRDDRADAERLCTHLAAAIEANGVKRPTVTKAWRDAARLMLDRDHRPEAEVHAAIDWCQAHEFWRSNVLSMPKLREQYDRLRLQAERERPGNGSRPSTTDQRVAAGASLIEKYARQEGIA